MKSTSESTDLRFDGPLFIVGMPRSGTKLLRTLLNNHPGISIAVNETEFLPFLVRNWESYGNLSDIKRFERFYNVVKRFPYMRGRAKQGTIISSEEWYRRCTGFDAATVFEALMRHDTNAHVGSGIIWGDKSPGYITKIPLLLTLYPRAKVIHIVRDVRDYCVSLRRAWGKNIYRAAQRWRDDIQSARNYGESTDRYCEVFYERILQTPEVELERICRFIGVVPVAEMTQLKKPSENFGAAKDAAFIVSGNFGKYATALTSREVQSIEEIASPLLRDLGYAVASDVRSRRVSWWLMSLYKIQDGLNVMIYGARRLGVIAGLRKYLMAFRISPSRVDD